MTDELDEYEDSVEREDAIVAELDEETEVSDAELIADVAEEPDETPFDETRLAYSGVEEGDGDVDVEELAEAGALLDDPESEALLDADPDDE